MVEPTPMLPAPPKRGRLFQPGNSGRKRGNPNKVPRLLKEAIIMAAELEGADGEGKGKMVGFLRKVAREDLRTFCGLLGRVIPLQIDSRHDEVMEVTYRSVAEVRRELASRGITMELVSKVMNTPLEPEPDLVEMDEPEEQDDGGDDAEATRPPTRDGVDRPDGS